MLSCFHMVDEKLNEIHCITVYPHYITKSKSHAHAESLKIQKGPKDF